MRALPLLLLPLAAAGPLAAQDGAAPEVTVRTSVDPADGAVLGQRVRVLVDVLFRGGMPRPPRVAIPDTPGAPVFRFETQATTINDRIGGQGYVGQRFEFALYPQRGGDLAIPASAITLLDQNGAAVGRAQGEPVRVAVTVPPGVDPSRPLVATDRLTLEEEWSPPPATAFKAGDAIVRRITRTAKDVPALVLGDPPPAAPDGVRAYARSPEREDRLDRGAVTGVRIDRITYVFEREGRFELPALRQSWWDLGAGTLRTAEKAGVAVQVAAAEPTAAPAAAPSASHGFRHRPMGWRTWCAVGLGLAAMAALAVAALGRRRTARARRPPARTEKKAFAELRRACRTADANAVYRALAAWRQRSDPALRPGIRDAARPLESALFGSSGRAWATADSRALIGRLTALRRAAARAAPVPPALPPLNPGLGGAPPGPPRGRTALAIAGRPPA